MENLAIRKAAKEAGIPLWKVAEQYGVTDSTFSRKLRRELPKGEQDKLLKIITSLKEG